MCEMMFTVLDADGSVAARRRASFVDVLLPALSDDPETVEELERAMQRFQAPDGPQERLRQWDCECRDEPVDAGLCLVDLAARLIVFQSTCCDLLRRGQVTFDPDPDRARWISYWISEEWHVIPPTESWREIATPRRQQRLANPPLDTRAVLYGRVGEFVVDRCLAARGGTEQPDGAWTPSETWQWIELPDRFASGRSPNCEDAIAEIHARWLMTPRSNLRGQTPRQVLMAKRKDLVLHLQDREMQWSAFRESPPPLWHDSIAYRYGGYGPEESIIYYHLLRHLIRECWQMLTTPDLSTVPKRDEAIDRLGAAQQEWLHTPNEDTLGGGTPIQLIQAERARMPNVISRDQMMIDDDCPLCQMLADTGPGFWHLDGCNMDNDFPFSLYAETREQFEQDREKWKEFEERFEDEWMEDMDDEDEDEDLLPDASAAPAPTPSIWQRSMVFARPNESPSEMMFEIGACLAELIVDLRASGASQDWIDTLNNDFSNLREVAFDSSSVLLEPVQVRFGEHLEALAEERPELAEKCFDLERYLAECVDRLNAQWDDDEFLF